MMEVKVIKHRLLVVALTLTLTSTLHCAKPPVESPSARSLAWLSGCWRADGAEAGSGEQWTPLAGGSMLGVSRTVQQGKTVAFEFMRIATEADGTIALHAQPSGKPATKFSVVSLSETQVIFENLHHDFPQRVIYEFHPPSNLKASIEGVHKSGHRRMEFPMVRANCETQLQ
jgi:Domain of unknown function (DUF6265)